MLQYFKESPFSVTICDQDGKILEMNDSAIHTFCKDGQSLVGKSLLDCHPEPAKTMLQSMLVHHNKNSYTIEKNGIKKMIYQTPWYEEGVFKGYIELSMEIPFEMPHFIRKPKA